MERSYPIEIISPVGVTEGCLWVHSPVLNVSTAIAEVRRVGEEGAWLAGADAWNVDKALMNALSSEVASGVVLRIRHRLFASHGAEGIRSLIEVIEELRCRPTKNGHVLEYRFNAVGAEGTWKLWADEALRHLPGSDRAVCCGTCRHHYTSIYGGGDARFAGYCFRDNSEAWDELRKIYEETYFLAAAMGPFEAVHSCPSWKSDDEKWFGSSTE